MERAWQCLKNDLDDLHARGDHAVNHLRGGRVDRGSYQAGRFLGPDDLIPTADKWIGRR